MSSETTAKWQDERKAYFASINDRGSLSFWVGWLKSFAKVENMPETTRFDLQCIIERMESARAAEIDDGRYSSFGVRHE